MNPCTRKKLKAALIPLAIIVWLLVTVGFTCAVDYGAFKLLGPWGMEIAFIGQMFLVMLAFSISIYRSTECDSADTEKERK